MALPGEIDKSNGIVKQRRKRRELVNDSPDDGLLGRRENLINWK
ncbi:hypothetical protein FOCG_14842 [Fusarium oxysporum f. sp. radicis-lycopersici 26381]|uniref:Uncharacterized protein n=1 Tax=Fusarium oxysporum Fo47 TaxID=660027 RepID=W9JN78_FUSOX|nr:hypothetical protein FOZG_13252 [Fusarium oxysporum Fo47]EWZ83421.1 hypothetical protein FOWG_13326 [Fusarium oxysporum f. sp. lycopersici MN25]EXL42371.1 hypothetical protein FOCG_14842 [Fusarium oxysporum f. sp. radicis-lycopersici 26381]